MLFIRSESILKTSFLSVRISFLMFCKKKTSLLSIVRLHRTVAIMCSSLKDSWSSSISFALCCRILGKV